MRAERAIIQFEDLLHNEFWPAEVSMTKPEAYKLKYDAEKKSPNGFCRTIAPREVRRPKR